MATDNRSVGRFILNDIPPSPRGVPQIEVSFDMDANGILSVTAKDKGTGKEQNIRIEASTGLSQEEIAAMKAEAEANADSDKVAREKVDKMNAADSLIFQTEKQVSEYGDKIPEDKRAAIDSALEELKAAHKSEDLDAVEAGTEKLNTAWQAASQDIYQASQDGAADPSGAEPTDSAEEETTDVEFEEVEE